jgi:hypothetical protein
MQDLGDATGRLEGLHQCNTVQQTGGMDEVGASSIFEVTACDVQDGDDSTASRY